VYFYNAQEKTAGTYTYSYSNKRWSVG
jgi:hypothetical protein